jgi:hypothetical protein
MKIMNATNVIDRSGSLLYKIFTGNGCDGHAEGGIEMRKLVTLVLAVGLLLGIAGNALANCGVDHANTPTPSSERPKPQT